VRNWKVNLAAAWVAQFLCIVGFTAAFPFLPFYIRDLGITDPDGVKLWTGLLTSAGPISMALMSPVWGVLADRRGRKLMVERATFGGAAVLAAMAFAGNVHQLLILRLIQGTLTGTVPAFITLVSSMAPASEVGFSLGLMQMAVYVGASVGPLIGGVVADSLGYRWAFGVTGIMLLFGGVLVHALVQEKFVPPSNEKGHTGFAASARTVAHSLPILGVVIALGGIYLGNQTARPLLPLLVETLQPDPSLVNTATGSVYGASAVASALSAAVVGRLADRWGHRRMLILCGMGAAVAYACQAFSPTLAVLIAAGFATGLFSGGLLPAANAVLARFAPREQQGAIYGISNSVNAVGRSLGPMLGALLATAWGLRAAFLAGTGLFVLVTVWVAATVKVQPPEADSP